MKVPLKWAKDFSELNCTPQEFADRMTMSGSKVETFDSEADSIDKVVVARVLSIVPHPDSNHMVITSIDAGGTEPVQIVTGAGNIKVGELVPAALDNSRLPGGKEIHSGYLRGVVSEGMLCSLGELGLTVHDFPNAIESGIMVLDEEYAPGTPIVEALGMNDVTVDFEITPNRPDCLSVKGLGREAAATFGLSFIDHVPSPAVGHGDVNDLLKVDIENADLCMRYIGAVVENVRVKPSPRWMRERLRQCGVRPINNLVDITNYVMLEMGQPMHCFDYRYVNGSHIIVRNAKENESIMTLDGIERPLSPEILIISDEEGPIAIAGVMGGEYSGVYEDTSTIVFESAMFDGPSVRTTAKKVGLRTEASSRYEKGLDPNGCLDCINRALELVQILDAGDVVSGVVDVWPVKRDERRIELRPDVINRLLGTNLCRQEMVGILLPLGFEFDGNEVIVPSYRWDVERDCDLAEEVARFVGYNNMPSTIMTGVSSARPTERQTFREQLLDTLVGFGLYEVESFSFYSRKAFDMINLDKDSILRRAVVISNPLGEDTSIMRTTALPNMMEFMARNYNARAESCGMFEDATVYIPVSDDPNDLPLEIETLTIASYGQENSFYYVKGIVEGLLNAARITNPEFTADRDNPCYHPGRCAVVTINGEKIGTIGEIHPNVLDNYGIKTRVYAAEINIDKVFNNRGATPLFTPLPRHPAITRDLALVCDIDTESTGIEKKIKAAAGEILRSIKVFDVYTGDKVSAGKKSIAYSLSLRADDRTLTDEEAEDSVRKILKALEFEGITLRS